MAYSILEGNPQCEALRDSLERFRKHKNLIIDELRRMSRD